ncbi:hypothetical protein [Methylotuvimicrobium sp. KM1]|uniref:hypothetical protein n=1 Tax=Methylotuvimicrobium sp. KM1 TaxID=3377707 RepID=UPI003850B419
MLNLCSGISFTEFLFFIVFFSVLDLLNISINTGFFVLIVLAIIRLIWVHFDRKKNPEKWAEIDRKIKEEAQIKEEKERPKVAENYYWRYQDAMKRISKSEWVLMNREEKSDVFKGREGLKQGFFNLPRKTQEFIIKKYDVDNRFPNID